MIKKILLFIFINFFLIYSILKYLIQTYFIQLLNIILSKTIFKSWDVYLGNIITN